jgi:hypothetical protein
MHEWWIEKIEGLKRDSRLSDVTLARRLDISPAMLAHVRMGRRALPLHARLRLLDALGYVITRDLLLRVLPNEVRSAIVDTNAAITEQSYAEQGPEPNAGLEPPPKWQ